MHTAKVLKVLQKYLQYLPSPLAALVLAFSASIWPLFGFYSDSIRPYRHLFDLFQTLFSLLIRPDSRFGIFIFLTIFEPK